MRSMGFNGQLHEAGTRWQLLGNGRRAYNPVLMRFHSPDAMSPFGKGGRNAYAYCLADPVNMIDPSGQFAVLPLMLGMSVAVGGAAMATAPLAQTEGGGSEGGSPWLIIAAIAGLLAVGAGVAGALRWRRPSMRNSQPNGGGPQQRLPIRHENSTTAARREADSWRPPQGERRVHAVDLDALHQPYQLRIQQIRDHQRRFGRPMPGGRVFKNREQVLPVKRNAKYYYKWFADEPEARIITGGVRRTGIQEIYATDDHYESFLRIRPPGGSWS